MREKGEVRFNLPPRDDATENGEEKPARMVSAAVVVDVDFFLVEEEVVVLEECDVPPPPTRCPLTTTPTPTLDDTVHL